MLILSAGPRYRHLSETRADVCLIPDTVFVLIGRRFRPRPRRRHLHYVGGRRVAGGVPCVNPVAVGRARIDGPVAEGRDMRPHLADLYKLRARAVTVRSLDAEPESAGPAFGPCQNHLATAYGDSDQIGRRLGKDGRENRLVILHPLNSDEVWAGNIRPVGARKSSCGQDLPESMRDGIGNCLKPASPFVLISTRCLSYGEGGGRKVRVNPPGCSGWRNGLFPRCSSSSSSAGCWSDSC